MDKSQLLNELFGIELQYYKACFRNGGHEGSVETMMYRAELQLLVSLLKKYFNEDYEYKLMV